MSDCCCEHCLHSIFLSHHTFKIFLFPSNFTITFILLRCLQYKDKSVVLERERFEALSALEMKGDEINRLKTELDTALEGKKFLEEELASVR